MSEKINQMLDELIDDFRYICDGALNLIDSIKKYGDGYFICDEDCENFGENVKQIFDKYFT